MHKLYYVPGTCALAPHIVLHEAKLNYQLEKVSRETKQTETGEDYNNINHKSYVPALVMNNGQLLTEVAVIVQYLADLAPAKRLAPRAGTIERYHLQEWLNFISSEIHKTFSPLFNPKLAEDAKNVFKERLALRLGIVAEALAKKDYLMDIYTVADAYLYTVLRWAPRFDFDLSPWPMLQSYMERIGERPAVKAALNEEGIVTV